jgi:hypothetical protein
MNQLHWQNNRNTNCTSLTVQRIGYGAMQLAGPGVWGPPRDPDDQAGRCGLCGVGGRCHMSSPNRCFYDVVDIGII